jgi:hypothetical protein
VYGPWIRAIAAVLLLFLAAACLPQGLAFVQDDRVEIVAPDPQSHVSLPVTIEWEAEDFEITGKDGRSTNTAGYFGVFVDTPPVPPGKPLAWIAHNDQPCISSPGCPDRLYLADRGVHATSETSFTLKQLPDLDAYQGNETHEVTVILLDGTGHRIEESAWHVTFFYDREV